MNMRIPVIATLCMAVGTVMAQPQHSATHEAERMQRLAILLDLHEGQQVEVAKVLQEHREAMREQRKPRFEGKRARKQEGAQRPSREALQKQREQDHAALIEQLRPILTDVQLKKFEALQSFGPWQHRGRK